MQLWLVSFILLFLAAEGLDWLGSLEWLKAIDLSLPIAVVGGIGLAIASNPRLQPSRPTAPQTSKPTDPSSLPSAPIPKAPTAMSPEQSISFEIKKRSPGSSPAN